MDDRSIQQISQKYKERLERSLDSESPKYNPNGEPEGTSQEELPTRVETREYEQFKQETLPPAFTIYETWANACEKFLKVQPSKNRAEVLQEAIDRCHLSITPAGAASFAMVVPLIIMLMGGLGSYFLFQSTFLLGFFILLGLGVMGPLGKIPLFLATKWRMRSSQQMVISIFYVVTFMRHTSNLEKGIQFASEHLSPPLSLDFKRILWDVETEKFPTVQESLDNYLEQWRETNMEFVEAFHLVESSLYEGSEDRRLEILDKSLDVILEGTYEKMLHFAQNLKSPINTLNMLGVILPILGLVILPLVVSFAGNVSWYQISAIYNIGLPLGVYFLGRNILLTRPSGAGGSGAGTEKIQLENKKTIRINGVDISFGAVGLALLVGLSLCLLGLSPVIIHAVDPDFEVSLLTEDGFRVVTGESARASYKLMDYQRDTETDKEKGPFGLGASLLSIFFPLGLGLGFATYFRMKSKDVIKLREESRKLEVEFASALFQLGNRLSDGFPAELVFGKVASLMQGTVSGRFFSIVDTNIRRMGMSVDEAIFNPKTGAINNYPSSLIESSMKVLMQSIRKGPTIAAKAMANVARYVKEIHQVNERLKDLMAEIISSISSQIHFLAPVIAGIVVGIASMITTILGRLGKQMEDMASMAGSGGGAGIMEMFGLGIPAFYFQIVVGLYVVQLSYILTILKNGIENGDDKVGECFELGKNMTSTVLLYSVVTAAVMLIFNIIAGAILAGTVD